MSGIREHLQPLELLDLQKSDTVGKIVDGLSRCSFGGRMLGQMADKLIDWLTDPIEGHPLVVYSRLPDRSEAIFLSQWLQRGWIKAILDPADPELANYVRGQRVLAIGGLRESTIMMLGEQTKRTLYINQYGQSEPGNIQDGYFPHLVVADPSYIIPILDAVCRERLLGESTTARSLVTTFNQADGLAGEAAHGYQALKNMVDDPDCTVFMTLSGAMTIAKMGLVICEMVDRGMVQYLASTGALIAHGLVESVGLKHFKHDPRYSDEKLGDEKLNRVSDTLEPEENLDEVATVIGQVLNEIHRSPISPIIFNRRIGKYLVDHYPGQRGILKSAYERHVPVAIPAFVDSEVGNDVFVHNLARQREGRPQILMNLELDSQVLMNMFVRAKRRGIFTIGGGVPRNNTQNVAPLIEIANARLGTTIPEATYDTGCRICPDPMWLGHLSGCTYSENASWRKVNPHAVAAGKFAEVRGDATMILPVIIRAIMDDQH